MITEKDLQIVFIVFYDNNATGYNQAFTNAGYSVPSDVTAAKKYVVRKMYDLYRSKPAELKRIMDGVEWENDTANYTTQQGDVRARMWGFLQQNITPSATGKGQLWTNLQSWLFGNQQTVTQQTVTTPSNAGAIAGVVGFSVLGIGVIVMAIILARRFASNTKALWITIIGAFVLLIIIGWLIYKSASKITSGSATTTSTTTGHGGLTDILGSVGAIFTAGWWSNIFGGGTAEGTPASGG